MEDSASEADHNGTRGISEFQVRPVFQTRTCYDVMHSCFTVLSVPQKLARVFRKGLLKAAKSTGAWIITSGINSGVVKYVGSALGDSGSLLRNRSKIVTIGIAPWGLLKRREHLVGKDASVSFHPETTTASRSRYATLNDKHSYFLLVDNGTVGRYKKQHWYTKS